MTTASTTNTSAATGRTPNSLVEMMLKKLLGGVAGHDGTALVGNQRKTLEHRIGAERDDDGRQAQADHQDAVYEAEPGAKDDSSTRRQATD